MLFSITHNQLIFEQVEKANRTLNAIYSYMDVVSAWLDDTDGRLNDVDSTKDQLRRASVSPLSDDYLLDGGLDKKPGNEGGPGNKGGPEDEGERVGGTAGDDVEDASVPKRLTEDERLEILDTIERKKQDLKVRGWILTGSGVFFFCSCCFF